MDVGVDEARHHRPAAEVEDRRRAAAMGGHVGGPADREDAPVPDRAGLRVRPARVHGRDAAVHEEQADGVQDLGRVLVVAGVALAAVGVVLYLVPSAPRR